MHRDNARIMLEHISKAVDGRIAGMMGSLKGSIFNDDFFPFHRLRNTLEISSGMEAEDGRKLVELILWINQSTGRI